jgi:hypothetical protein
VKKLEAMFDKHPILWQMAEQVGLEIIDVKEVSGCTFYT